MKPDSQASDFFTAGGTLPPNAPSYVKRPTDDELFEYVTAGEFCYVLTPRQMGKSSLMIRTAQRLQEAGVRSAIVDLTVTGTVESEDQWYKGILTQIKRRLRISIDPVSWWEGKRDIPNVQKFVEFFEEVLSEVAEHIVIFFDEIDTTLKLEFRDDFFAGIRAIYNGRASNPNLRRITFILLGVASPSDLIKDRNRTPFNIGQEISLRPFRRDSARMLEIGLEEAYPKFGQRILDRIFYWTNGHPYLTQKLCQSIVEAQLKGYTDNEVDGLVRQLFTSQESSRETNLQFVRDNILGYPERRIILSLYKRILNGFLIADDRNSLPQNHLKLSGLARVDDGKLVVSNRIYRSVFDQKWVSRYTSIDWRYPIIATLTLIVIGFTSVFYNDGIRLPNQAATRVSGVQVYYQDERGIQELARLFRMSPFIFANAYEYEAKDVFFNSFSTREEQIALIDVTSYEINRTKPEDYETVVLGIYTGLADVDSSGETTSLLEVMHTSMKNLGMQNEAVYQEIGYWLDARDSVAKGNFEDALAQYISAIELNNQNPATLFERARVYVELQEYQKALSDYEQVVAIVPRNVEPTESAALTSMPTYTSQQTPAVVQGTTLAPVTKVIQSDITSTLTFDSTISPSGELTKTPTPPTPTKSTTPTQSNTPTPTATVTVTVMPNLRPIQSRFLTRGQRNAAVRNDIYQNESLVSALLQGQPEDYPNLLNNGLILSPTPTPTPVVLLDEQFDNLQYDGSLNGNLWTVRGETNPDVVKHDQSNNELLSVMQPLESQDSEIHSVQKWPIGEIDYAEWRLKFDDTVSGDWASIATGLSAGTDERFVCDFMFNVGSNALHCVIWDLQAEITDLPVNIALEPNTWYTIRIMVRENPLQFIVYLDGKLILTHIVEDTRPWENIGVNIYSSIAGDGINSPITTHIDYILVTKQ